MEPRTEALSQGRYELRHVLGRGGMATVYAAWDTALRVQRAVKVLDPALTQQPSMRRRFQMEAQAMARLAHPNVVSVYDVGDDGTHLFIVMELVEGHSLMEFVDHFGSVDPRTATRLACDVLRGLEVAHKAGIVHRDIKPHNILLTTDGVPKLTDFGIAQVRSEGDPGLTRTGSVLGTLAYMAPEQRAALKETDARADLYAVAATLVSVITADFPGDLFVQELHERLLTQVHPALAPVIVRATRYDPADRYASAGEMVAALEEASAKLPDVPEGAPRPGVRFDPAPRADGGGLSTIHPGPVLPSGGTPYVSRAPPPATRRWRWAFLALPVVGIAAWWLTQPEPPAPVIAPPEPPTPVVLARPTDVPPPVVTAPPPVAKPAPVKPTPAKTPTPIATPPAAPAVESNVRVKLKISASPRSTVEVNGMTGTTLYELDVHPGHYRLHLAEEGGTRTKDLDLDVASTMSEVRVCWDHDKGTGCGGGNAVRTTPRE